MKNFLLIFLLIPSFLFGADAANDIIITQRNSGNTGNVQRNLTGTANALMGTNGSGVATTVTAGSGISIVAGVITATGGGSGTVTSVGFTGGIISVATATTTPALTVAGTSGGVVYFSSTSTWASSALLAANAIMIGGGAGTTPSTTTTAAGVLTFIGVPSSANLRTALTDETGTGLAVFATDPTFTLTDITTNNASTSQHGWLQKLPGGTTTFLRGDGTFATPAGSGTVTTTGTMTATAIVTSNGTTVIMTPNASTTIDSSGNFSTPGGISTGVGGSVAGYYAYAQGTATTAPTSSVGFQAPTTVTTKFMMTLPGAPVTGFLLSTGTTDPTTLTFVAPTGTGAVALADSPVFTTKIQTPTIELGNASDTTLARNVAGVISVEGNIVSMVGPRITSITSSATPTFDVRTCDIVNITALATAITSMTSSGTFTGILDGQQIEWRILDNGTARAITWGASFASGIATLPTTTTVNKALCVYFEYDAVQVKLMCQAVGSYP